ncbi:MAG: T9SS type A sorting domain-containing protein, partial [Bacteroidota bacterium]
NACSGDVALVTSNNVGGQNIHYSWNTGTNSSVVLYSDNIGGPFVSGPFSTTGASVYAQFGAVVTSGYNICVQGVNGCGSTNNGCTFVRGKVGVPTSINGSVVACQNDVKPYSCALSGGASLYTWTLAGSGLPVTSGQGSANISVTFPPAFTSGQLCVTAALACGGSSTSAPRCVTVSNTPVVPGAMTGPAKVCPGQTGVVFSVPAVTGATGYNWTVPVGATITSGTNTISITVSFPASYTGAPPVCAYALSSCASSVGRCKAVGSNIPGQPGSVTGPTTGVCNSTVQYSISSLALATSYTWTIPVGSTGFLGQGSTAIQFTVPPSPFTSGQVTVVANTTACTPGTSTPRTITINGAPGTPGNITPNPSAWCDGGFVNFSITPSSPLPVYQWIVTNGTIDAGQNSNNIDVTWGTGAGVAKVRGTNSCGASSYRVLNASSINCGREQESSGFTKDDNLTVYPNPAHDKVTIEINNSIDELAHVTITDLMGNLVLDEKMQLAKGLTTLEIDLSHFAKGAYMLSAEKTSGIQRQRIMVQ